MSYAVREGIRLQRILSERLNMKKGSGPINFVVRADNQGAIALAKNDVGNERTKHIDVKYHFLREYVELETVTLEWIATKKMVAEELTKLLAP